MKHAGRISYAAMVGAAALALWVACGDDNGSGPPPGGGGGTDTTAPQPVDDLSLAFDSLANEAVFTWTAPQDDIATPRVDRYEIRYGGSFPFDWEQSTRVATPPDPADPGTIQHFHLADPRHGRDLYASVRSYDAAGNESPAGSVAHLFVPGFSFDAICFDTYTGGPVAGLDAVVTTRSVNQITTGADGRIALSDLSDGSLGVLIERGSAPAAYHTFNDGFTLDSDVAVMYAMIPFQQTNSALYPSLLAFLKIAVVSPGASTFVKTWATLPVKWYAPDFVSTAGTDYGALAQQAAEHWNERLGFTLFERVASDPAVGVLMEFLPRSVMGTTVGVTEYSNDANGYPHHDRIRIVDDITDESRLYPIMMHELGHTIPLGHLPAGFLMYSGQPLPLDITDDEIAVVKLLLAVPNGILLDKYDGSPPAP